VSVMEEYKQHRRLTVGVDGDARSSDSSLVVSLPAETVEYGGEEFVYQREYRFLEESLSDLESRDRSVSELVDEYSELVEEYGGECLSLIDAEPEPVEFDVIGILDWQRHNAACYFEVPDEVERGVISALE